MPQKCVTWENLVLWPEVTSSAWFTLELEELSFYPGELLLKRLYCLPVFFLQIPDLISEIVPESFILGCQLTQSLGMLCFHDHVLRLYRAEPENSIHTKREEQTPKYSFFTFKGFFKLKFNSKIATQLFISSCKTRYLLCISFNIYQTLIQNFWKHTFLW